MQPEACQGAIEASLQKLGADYIDLYFRHRSVVCFYVTYIAHVFLILGSSPDAKVPIKVGFSALAELVE